MQYEARLRVNRKVISGLPRHLAESLTWSGVESREDDSIHSLVLLATLALDVFLPRRY